MIEMNDTRKPSVHNNKAETGDWTHVLITQNPEILTSSLIK